MQNFKPDKYFRSELQIDFKKMKDLEEINEKKPWIDLVVLYFFTYFVVSISVYLTKNISLIFYPFLIFFIAGRQGAFLQLIHEAAHNLISKNVKINNFFGGWLTSYLIGINYKGYTTGHHEHHKYTSTPHEPKADSEKYVIVDFKDPKLYLLFLKDLIGITALKIFFDYGNDKLNKQEKNSTILESLFNKSKVFIKLGLVQLVILYLFNFNIIYYFMFWVYPAMGPHMFLMRIRGIAEHGLGKKLGKKILNSNEGRYYTRSFLTDRNRYNVNLISFFEKLLIGSFNVNFHHEHHLNSKVPYYNLKKFHNLVHSQIKDNIKPDYDAVIYEKGYFSAFFSTVFVSKTELV
tara:strand:+ start:3799 stop:4842 length:1044 start_codon:yes stop_codon:yes gene_type:complete